MVWWLVGIGAVIGLIIAIIEDDDCFLSILGGALMGLLVSIVLFAVFSIVACDAPGTVHEGYSYELVALNDDADGSISGLFFLGTGSVSSDEDLEYVFIYETEKGMTVGERKAKSVYVQYIAENETPRLVHYVETYDSGFWDWLLGNKDSWDVFYIPEGSITTDFEIDLK